MADITTAHVAGISSESGPYPSYVQYGDIIAVSGQVSFDDAGEIVGIDDVAAQTDTSIDRLERVLSAAGSSLTQVISATVYLKSAADAAVFNAVWKRRFTTHRPARATVVADLLDERLLVEISATAVAGSGTAQ